ncbi:PXYP1-like protein [Mya arenaria]|uniref:PXYP1-like protein n=1 Tax=Mya arenaria TaxID=6604 RepID=A0ABY7DG07_MYAAR|nr:PXYP1-like protein [Mya arenaria]
MATQLACLLIICLGLTMCVDMLMVADHGGQMVVDNDGQLTNLDQLYCNSAHKLQGIEGQSDLSATMGTTDLHLPPLTCDLDPIHTSAHLPLAKMQMAVSEHADKGRSHPEFKSFFPTFPKQCTSHHLTPHGFHQAITIGNHLRVAYMSNRNHKKLQPLYSAIHVESVAKHDAYQSVLGVLHGMLPQKQFSKIKIHKSHRNFCDSPAVSLPSCQCAKTQELSPFISQALGSGRYAFKNSFPDVHIHSDIKLQLSNLQIYQLLMQYKCNNMTLACDQSKLCSTLKKSSTSDFYRSAVDHQKNIYSDPMFKSYSRLKSYPFLQRLLSHSVGAARNQSMFVSMGDKFFLQYVASSLHLTEDALQPLASRLVFEIFSKNTGPSSGSELLFRVLYNGRDLTSNIPGCKAAMKGPLCPIDILVTIVQYVICSVETVSICIYGVTREDGIKHRD